MVGVNRLRHGRRKPPRQRCRECGGDYYGWGEGRLCSRCLRGDAWRLPPGGVRELRRSLPDWPEY